MGWLKSLCCLKCGWDAPAKKTFQCPSCGTVLEAVLDFDPLSKSILKEIHERKERTIWRWFEFLPVQKRSAIVSLGEGYTPLLQSKGLSEALGIASLYLKNDTVLPTGSLKDRSNSVGISKAKELGFKTAAVASTGNAAASVAAYAAAAGLKSVVMVPEGTSASKLAQAKAYGATLLVIKGDFDEVARLYRSAVEEFGWYDCLSTNPYRNEGKKSYAYELLDQLEGQVPHWIIHPTAGGTGIYAMWKGYNELLRLGSVFRVPRLAAAQSEGAAPFAAALEKGLGDIEPFPVKPTVAESIQVGHPKSMGSRALKAIRASKGAAVAASDEEILEAQSLLARLAGIFAEPAGAVSVAAARKLRQTGVVGVNDLVVCTITGSGLKQPSAVRLSDTELKPVPANLDALHKRLQ